MFLMKIVQNRLFSNCIEFGTIKIRRFIFDFNLCHDPLSILFLTDQELSDEDDGRYTQQELKFVD